MIITKTPYRISFFGGGSDYPDWFNSNSNYGEVISTTVDKYLYLTLRDLPDFFGFKYRASYSKIEESNTISNIEHRAIRGAIRYFSLNSAEIHYVGDLPSRSGMGSSSSFVVGLINAIYALKNKNIDKKKLAMKSIFFENSYLNEIVGVQDQIAASYGGFNIIKFQNNKFTINPVNQKSSFLKKLNSNLVLLYTGQSRISQKISRTFVKKIANEKKKNILKILDHVNQAKVYINKNSPDDFGDLLNETWIEKKKLSSFISNRHIDGLYKKAIKFGALGGKLLGAGGGGFLLFYVPEKKRNFFLKKFIDNVIIPFNFSTEGSSIVFDNNVKKI
jgi:D-glycero-alpha-D-manno-heptose-7-phosphate kinase